MHRMQRTSVTEPLPLLALRQSNSNPAGAVVSVASTVFVVIVGLTLISRWMIRICRPHEMLVVTGSKSNQEWFHGGYYQSPDHKEYWHDQWPQSPLHPANFLMPSSLQILEILVLLSND